MTPCLALCREVFLDFQNLIDACGETPKFLVTVLIFLIKLRGQLDLPQRGLCCFVMLGTDLKPCDAVFQKEKKKEKKCTRLLHLPVQTRFLQRPFRKSWNTRLRCSWRTQKRKMHLNVLIDMQAYITAAIFNVQIIYYWGICICILTITVYPHNLTKG